MFLPSIASYSALPLLLAFFSFPSVYFLFLVSHPILLLSSYLPSFPFLLYIILFFPFSSYSPIIPHSSPFLLFIFCSSFSNPILFSSFTRLPLLSSYLVFFSAYFLFPFYSPPSPFLLFTFCLPVSHPTLFTLFLASVLIPAVYFSFLRFSSSACLPHLITCPPASSNYFFLISQTRVNFCLPRRLVSSLPFLRIA